MHTHAQIHKLISGLPPAPMKDFDADYSGRLNVRLPKSLHAALASEAEDEGVSLNQLIVTKLSVQLKVAV